MQSKQGETSRLSRYLDRLRRGVAADEAARELGDPGALQRELEGYIRGRVLSRRIPMHLTQADEPSDPRLLDVASRR